MRPEDEYTLDDLVAHERGNLRLVAILFVGAVLYALIWGRPPGLPGGEPESGVAEVDSAG